MYVDIMENYLLINFFFILVLFNVCLIMNFCLNSGICVIKFGGFFFCLCDISYIGIICENSK